MDRDMDQEDTHPSSSTSSFEVSTTTAPSSTAVPDAQATYKMVYQKTADGSSKPVLIKIKPRPTSASVCSTTDCHCDSTFEVMDVGVCEVESSSPEVESTSSSPQPSDWETEPAAESSPQKPLEEDQSEAEVPSTSTGATAESRPQPVKLKNRFARRLSALRARNEALMAAVTANLAARKLEEAADGTLSADRPRGKVLPPPEKMPRFRCPNKTKSQRAGLTFPVGRIHRLLKKATRQRVSATAGVYTGAVLEYLTAELEETSGNNSRDDRRKLIKPRDVLLAVAQDDDMDKLFQAGNVMLPGAGTVPLPEFDSSFLRNHRDNSGQNKTTGDEEPEPKPKKKKKAKELPPVVHYS